MWRLKHKIKIVNIIVYLVIIAIAAGTTTNIDEASFYFFNLHSNQIKKTTLPYINTILKY